MLTLSLLIKHLRMYFMWEPIKNSYRIYSLITQNNCKPLCILMIKLNATWTTEWQQEISGATTG